jgi:hypothetical protein
MACSLGSRATPTPNGQNWGTSRQTKTYARGGFRFQEALIDLTTARVPITRRYSPRVYSKTA